MKSTRKRRDRVTAAVLVALAAAKAWFAFIRPWTMRPHAPSSARPAHWAVPMAIPELPNLHKVSEQLYRGAQPTAEGIRRLKELGVRTVVNLRNLHSDHDEIGDSGLKYVHIGMNAWNAEEADVVEFLKVVSDPENWPAFVHCEHGSDRTGTMCAVYRIVVQGWTIDEAVREMTEGGMGFHETWQNLPAYLRSLDVPALKQKLQPPP